MQEEQITEWKESQVTAELRKLVASHIEDILAAKGIHSFIPGEPNRTQEILAGLIGEGQAWETFLEILEGDWDTFEYEEVNDDI